MKRVTVFCGSSSGTKDIYTSLAKDLGEHIAKQKMGLIYGGASIGLMGTVATTALKYGAEVIGIIPTHLAVKEVVHDQLTELIIVNSMHERKQLMAEKADAFIALPGGFGTFEEFCEILTWSQLGLHQKPIGLLNVNDYYNPLLQLFDNGVREGFIKPEHRALVLDSTEITDLFRKFEEFHPPDLPIWLKSQEES